MNNASLIETGIAFVEAGAAALERMGYGKRFILGSLTALSVAAAAFAPQEVSAGTRSGMDDFIGTLTGGTEARVLSVNLPSPVTPIKTAKRGFDPRPQPRG